MGLTAASAPGPAPTIAWNVCYRPYAYDVTEGRPRVLGVKRGTAMCAIAKHAASRPTPACHTAGPVHWLRGWERQRSSSTTRARSATSLDPQHGVIVMETWRQCIRSILRILIVWIVDDFSKPPCCTSVGRISCFCFVVAFCTLGWGEHKREAWRYLHQDNGTRWGCRPRREDQIRYEIVIICLDIRVS